MMMNEALVGIVFVHYLTFNKNIYPHICTVMSHAQVVNQKNFELSCSLIISLIDPF